MFKVQTRDIPDTSKSLVKNHEDFTLKQMINQAYIILGNLGNDFSAALPTMKEVTPLTPDSNNALLTLRNRQIKSSMIAERIKLCLKLSDWENLRNDAGDYDWRGD